MSFVSPDTGKGISGQNLPEDVEGLDLQDVAHHWTAHSPAIAGGSILGIVITDIELSDVERLGLQSSD